MSVLTIEIANEGVWNAVTCETCTKRNSHRDDEVAHSCLGSVKGVDLHLQRIVQDLTHPAAAAWSVQHAVQKPKSVLDEFEAVGQPLCGLRRFISFV